MVKLSRNNRMSKWRRARKRRQVAPAALEHMCLRTSLFAFLAHFCASCCSFLAHFCACCSFLAHFCACCSFLAHFCACCSFLAHFCACCSFLAHFCACWSFVCAAGCCPFVASDQSTLCHLDTHIKARLQHYILTRNVSSMVHKFRIIAH